MQQGPEPASSDAGESAQPVVSLHGFQFHSRCQKIDWRRIAAVDVDQVAREVDVNALQKNVTHLTFCDIDHELEGTSVDTNFVKLFKLAQLCIEYLMYSQDLLLQSLADTEEQLAEATQALEEERKFRICDQEAIRELQRENRKRRRIIENQQLEMLRSDRLALTGAPCPYCRKVFVSLAYLQAHVVRRHPDKPAPTEDALLAQWQRVATGTALPAASELHRGLQELRGLLLQKDDDHAEDKLLLRDELLCRLDELQRKCDSMAVGGRKVGVAAAGEASSWELSAEPPGSFSEGQTALASLSQQLVQQREEVSRLLAQQERLFLQRMDALSRDVVALTKTSTTLERKLSQMGDPIPARGHPRHSLLYREGAAPQAAGIGVRPDGSSSPLRLSRPYSEAVRASPLRFPQSTLSVPVPAPRQRMFFNGKGLRQPPSLTLPRKDSRLHAKVAQSGPIKERHESSTESLRPFPSGWSSPLQAVLRGRHLTRQAAKGDSRSERMKSAVHSTPNLIDALKEEIMDLTRNKLSGIGINELGKVSVTDSIFRDCSRRLNSERRLLAKKNKKFFDVRHRSGPPTEDLSTPKATQGSPDGSWPFEVNSLNSSKVAIPPSSIPNSDTPKESFAFKCQTPASSEASPSRGEGVASSCRFSTATPAPLSSSGSGAQRPRRFLARSCRSRQPSSIATSHDLIKPLISSSDDDEGVVGVRQRNLAGATSSRYPSVASKTHPPPGRLRSSRPQTRITDLVQSIESQLLKRSARPPMGAVNTVSEGAHRKESEQKVEAAVLNSGDQRIATDLVGAARPAVSSSGAERKGRPPVLKDYIDDEESMEEVS
nr:cilium assembly protein DZIP1L-like isoform X1 [Dermacentor andersoni]